MLTKNSFKVLRIDPQKIFSIEETKNYLRISNDYDDLLIGNLIEFAIDFAENFTSLTIKTRLIEFTSNRQNTKVFLLKYNPVLQIENIALVKGNVEEEVKDYQIDEELWMLQLPKCLQESILRVQYIAGFTPEALPQSIKQGILLHVSQMYDRSEQTNAISDEVRSLYLLHRKPKV